MPFATNIDVPGRRAYLKRWGPVSLTELRAGVDALLSDPQIAQVDKVISDMSEADYSAVSGDEYRTHASVTRERMKGMNLQVGLLAPSTVLYGLARMFGPLADMEDLRIFQDRESALEWLGAPGFPDGF